MKKYDLKGQPREASGSQRVSFPKSRLVAIKGTILRKHQTVFVFDTVKGSAYVIVRSKKMSTYRIDYKPVYVHRLYEYVIRYMQKFCKDGVGKRGIGAQNK